MIARLALAALALVAAPLAAQDAPVPSTPLPATAAVPKPAIASVTLQTSEGPIVLELEKERAPITTANFLRYVDAHRLDGTTFYRVVNVGEGFGLVQGGLRNDPKKLFAAIRHEPTTTTHLSHLNGTVSMARAAPGTATMDFFITVGDLPSLDAAPSQPGDNLGYAAFGRVAEGMDIVKHLLAEPTKPGGPAGMEGQMLAQPVRIISAKRTE